MTTFEATMKLRAEYIRILKAEPEGLTKSQKLMLNMALDLSHYMMNENHYRRALKVLLDVGDRQVLPVVLDELDYDIAYIGAFKAMAKLFEGTV